MPRARTEPPNEPRRIVISARGMPRNVPTINISMTSPNPRYSFCLPPRLVEGLPHRIEEPARHQGSRDGARDGGRDAFQIDVPMPQNPAERAIINRNEKAEHQSQADSENSYGVGNAPVEQVGENENDQQHAEQGIFDKFRSQPVDAESQNQNQGRQGFDRRDKAAKSAHGNRGNARAKPDN